MIWRASHASEMLHVAQGMGSSGGDAYVELLRRAALLADVESDTKVAFKARIALVETILTANSDADVIASFSWLLHTARHETEEYGVEDMLWHYKWVVLPISCMASISKECVDDVLEEMERRYVLAGLSTAAVAQLRLEVAIMMNLQDELPELFQAWQRNESGAGSDCDACRLDRRVQYFAAIGDHERAVKEAKPFIENTMRCAEIPRCTYPLITLSIWRLGRSDEADRVYRKGMARLGDSARIPPDMGMYLVYLALRGRFEEACALMTTWVRRVILSPDDLMNFHFLRGQSLLFTLAKERGIGVVPLVMPPTWEGFRRDGLYEVEYLNELFHAQATKLAARFDARHGNSGYIDQLQQDREMLAECR